MWLYIPPQHLPEPSATSSASAPGSADLNSASTLPSTHWERLDGVWFTWRGKPQPPQAWSRQWKRGGFIRRLSGLTCEPSMLSLGAASFISSLRAIPARTTALPESAPGPMANASSPPKLSALPPPAGLILSSARTSRGTPADSLRPLSRHWSDWATALRQEYSARPKPATPCGASDCSSWPSPMAGSAGTENYNAAGNSDFSRKAMELAEGMLSEWMAPVADDTGTRTKRYGQGGMALSMQSAEWAAPQARDHFPPHSPERIAAMKAQGHGMRNLNDEAATWRAPSDISKRGGSQPMEKRQAGGHSVNLEDQAEHWNGPKWSSPKASDPQKAGPNMRGSKGDVPLPGQAAQWAAPVATSNWKGSSEGSILRQDGKSRADLPHYQAEQLFHPPSSPAPAIAAGSMSSTDSPNSNQPSVRRKLNPIFVEALMRWPTGLSGFERPETGWIPSPLPTHFYACTGGSNAPTLHRERDQDLPALRQRDDAPTTDTPILMGKTQMVRSDLHGGSESAEAGQMQSLPSAVSASHDKEAWCEVLLDPVCEHRQADQGTVSQDQGWAEGSATPSSGERAGNRATLAANGNCPPSRSSQAEQLTIKLNDYDQFPTLARTYDGQPKCASLSPIDVWWLLMPSLLFDLCSSVTPSEPEQGSLF